MLTQSEPNTTHASETDVDLLGVRRDPDGKPVLPIEPEVLYRFGHLIRSTEELLLTLFSQGLLSGTTHTCLGQEFCQMSVVRALTDPGDVVLSNHRNHGHFLTYTGDVQGLVAEIMGRESGVCRGVGGSQHLAFRRFHSNGVQAGMTAIAAGLALAEQRRGGTSVVACFIGDGTLGEGLTYESFNLAAVWKVPLLFVVERNGIAQTTPTADTTAGSILARGAAFGLRTFAADDADPALWQRAEDAVEWVRSTREPGFLVIDTMRLGPHSKGDDLRDVDELSRIKLRDPLSRLGDSLAPNRRAEIDEGNRSGLETVRQAAMQSTESRYAVAPKHAFVSPCTAHPWRPTDAAGAAPGAAARPGPLNVRASLNAALREMLSERPEVLLLGEDLHEPYGGAFKVTAGLSSAFPGRVLSTPISEAGVVGAAIGLALAGFRPIVEIMFADFLTLAMDQIYNHAVKFPGMFRDVSVPIVIRTPAGGGRGYGPTHSQSPENLMTAVPGLTVVFPSHRHDSGCLLQRATIDWPHPVVFFEHKLLYGVTQQQEPYAILDAASGDPGARQFPTLVQSRRAPDLTLVAYGGMLPVVERVAAELEAEDFQIEIVAPSLLQPVPKDTLSSVLLPRPRVAIVEESHLGPGFGSELAATLLERQFQGRLARFAPPPVPIPAARSLEAQILTDERQLFADLVQFITATDRH